MSNPTQLANDYLAHIQATGRLDNPRLYEWQFGIGYPHGFGMISKRTGYHKTYDVVYAGKHTDSYNVETLQGARYALRRSAMKDGSR